MEAERIKLEQWRQWHGDGRYTMLPYVRRIAGATGALPELWDRVWADASPYACILESGKTGRYTFVGIDPVSVLEGTNERSRELRPDGEGERGWSSADGRERAERPIAAVRRWLADWRAPRVEGLPDFVGGAIGFWGYDTARSLERLPSIAADDLGMPVYAFQRFERLWIADRLADTIYAAVLTPIVDGERRGAGEPAGPQPALMPETLLEARYRAAQAAAAEMETAWRRWLSIAEDGAAAERLGTMRKRLSDGGIDIDIESLPDLRVSMTKAEYKDAVRRVQQYIGQGDVFQVNLSVRQSRPTSCAPETLYEWLRLVNPSPYMGMIRTPGFALVSASPELLAKRSGERLSTRPIAGTRRRGRTEDEDRAMEAELLASEKERAEHVMLVDLERNDLGRVSAYGSVRVPELLTVERYSHVMHLVSQVEGRLAPGKDALDVIAAAFPGGTITGAPKIRTMQIIEELEPVRRGCYTGSMGWIDYAGDMEFNIIIRTMLVKDGLCHIQAGAGIVIDSDPEREYYESLNKAKALWTAAQYGERMARGTPMAGRAAHSEGDAT